MTAGAYGAVQSGFYNTRALVPEVLVKDDQYAVVRPRIEVEELIAMDRHGAVAVIFRSCYPVERGATCPRRMSGCQHDEDRR